MLNPSPAFMVAGTKSGCGKTTMALGLMAAFEGRGIEVAPFKTGPDFIDPGFHRRICRRPSHNLDGWMMPDDAIREVFFHASTGCDVAIVEGAMGLFDGAAGRSERGSSAHVAKLLGIPVVLVADGRGIGRSICAMVKGYLEYDPEVKIAAVVVNNAGSQRHRHILKEALRELAVPFVAVVGRDPAAGTGSRHLGLVTADEHRHWDGFVGRVQGLIERNVDLDALLRAVSDASVYCTGSLASLGGVQGRRPSRCAGASSPVRIAVAMDEAFCFYYQRNLEILERLGAELVFFSPRSGQQLPEGSTGLYMGGGYPELHAEALAANRQLCSTLRLEVDRGFPVLAECGGFMFLGKGLVAGEDTFEWCGVVDSHFSMAERFQALGYREVVLVQSCLLGQQGTRFRGHEFRYSRPVSDGLAAGAGLQAFDSAGRPVEVPHFVYKNLFASYIHIHFDSNPSVAECFVNKCREYGSRDI